LQQKSTHLSIISYKLPSHTPFYKEWPLSSLKDILRHRFILRKSALNFLFKDGTSLLLNFPDIDPTFVLQRILSFTKGEIFLSINTRLYNTIKLPQIIEKTKFYKKWLRYEITNFEYLMNLNAFAGRSYYDITQYPVFPWIIRTYSFKELPLQVLSPEKIFRNLSKSMGALGDQERINTFKERFEHTDVFDPVPNYHFGSHYSSPAIILQYLIRLAPYNYGHKELQGGKFDLADRLFFSLQESFKGATEEISDVRELTPEFYFCPEFLLNLEGYDFGLQQTGNRVHNVKLPLWSQKPVDNSNPYHFIKMHRELLEGDYVNEMINSWIDLIFGYKQRGKEAVNSLNTFFYLTYEDGIDLEKLQSDKYRISYESQIIHFGQTPKQIFAKPHLSRPSLFEIYKDGKIITDKEYQDKSYKYNKSQTNMKKIGNEANDGSEGIIAIKFISDHRIGVIKKNNLVSFYSWSDSPFGFKEKEKEVINPFQITPERDEIVDFEQREFEGNLIFPYTNLKVGFLKKGKIVVSGGDFDGCLKVFFLDFMEDSPKKYYRHREAITALEIDPKERFLITGSKSGECIYWLIYSDYRIQAKYIFYDHEGEIANIHISENMRAFVTAGADQKVFVYNYMNGQTLKSFSHADQHPINNAVLSSSPLPIIVFHSNQDQTIYSYSINGQLLEKIKEESIALNNFTICKTVQGLDILVKNFLIIRFFYKRIRFIQRVKGN